ncbi:MAG: amidohydrolase family protein [Adhaeribacter sp.]
MNRRQFFTCSALSAAALAAGRPGDALAARPAAAPAGEQQQAGDYDPMKELHKYRKLDCHIHVNLFHGGPEENLKAADRLGIERMVLSRPVNTGPGSPQQFRESNDLVMQAVKKYPGRFSGQMTVNVQHPKESLEEIKRCVDLGMVGLKVYTQVKINDPLFYPVIEKMADLNMIIHMHAYAQLGLGGYRMKYDVKSLPNTSIPEDFADIAKRYPEAMFQYAHIGAGGDWEYACKMLKSFPNVYVDSSGSSNDEYMLDFAVRELGEDRIFFGSDNFYFQAVGKVLACNLSETQKKKIFFDNYNAVLKRSGNAIA